MRLFLALLFCGASFAQTTVINGWGGGGGGASPAGPLGATQFSSNGALGGTANNLLVPVPLTTPAAPTVTVTCSGTCTTDYGYHLSAITPVGLTDRSAGAVGTNAAVLDASHYNLITPPSCAPYQTGWYVLRDPDLSSVFNETHIASIACGATLKDTGLAQWGIINSSNNYSAGSYVNGALRSTGPVNTGPDYLIAASQNPHGDGNHHAQIDDATDEDIIDWDGNAFVENSRSLTIYNSNATNGVLSAPIGMYGMQGVYADDGTTLMTGFLVRDTTTTTTFGAQTTDVFRASKAAGATIMVSHFANLKACNTNQLDGDPTEGSLKPVDDSTVNTWGAIITGGGTNHVLAYCDGTNWTVAAK